MSRDRYYVLDEEHNIVAAEIGEWGRFFEQDGKRRVGLDTVGEAEVSTVFLGIDHNWSNEGPPILFETMVFGGPLDEQQWRYHTWEEAKEGHEKVVEMARSNR